MRYEIRLACEWSPSLVADFADVSARREGSTVVLCGDFDQAALHGLLERIRVRRIELIEVRRARTPRRRTTGSASVTSP
jgi:hypothetical protein